LFVWKNGTSLGELYDNIPQNKFIYPACSLQRYQQVEYNFWSNTIQISSK